MDSYDLAAQMQHAAPSEIEEGPGCLEVGAYHARSGKIVLAPVRILSRQDLVMVSSLDVNRSSLVRFHLSTHGQCGNHLATHAESILLLPFSAHYLVLSSAPDCLGWAEGPPGLVKTYSQYVLLPQLGTCTHEYTDTSYLRSSPFRHALLSTETHQTRVCLYTCIKPQSPSILQSST